MKMVKSLLLGSAAGIVAVVGAQAADLPVKAKPVEYVKVCSLYGAGFWYVPGTDTCIKIGSYLRVQTAYGAEAGGVPIGANEPSFGGRQTRTDTSDFSFRTRGVISLDLRTQTEYGTLRSYLNVGAATTTSASASAGANPPSGDVVYMDRAFIQFAGFTAGRVRSFFDINSFGAYSYNNTRVQGDTGATGLYALAYTAQLGNGFTATLAVEDAGGAGGSAGGRGRLTVNLSQLTPGAAFNGAGVLVNAGGLSPFALTGTTTNNRGYEVPDVVGALRVDQAWGYAQVSAALHDVAGGYYVSPATGSLNGSQPNGHPDDELGWAATAGFTLKNVLGLQGDEFALQAAYSQGASGYVTRALGPWMRFGSGNSLGVGWMSDAVFANGTQLELTEVLGIHAVYQHRWTPQWKTSLYGGYVDVNYNNNAQAFICGANPASPLGFTNRNGALPVVLGGGFTPGGVSNCDPDYSWWQAGTRTQWNPHKDLDIGLDLLYTRLNTAFAGTAVMPINGARPSGLYAIEDQDIFSAFLRIQRNFLY